MPAALTDPSQKVWKLVYHDAKSLIYMREPRRGCRLFRHSDAPSTLEEQSNYNVAHGLSTLCAQPLGEMFTRIGDWTKARQ